MGQDLDDVRAGCCMVQQAKGMSMKQMDIELEKKFSAIYQDSYPVRFHQMVLVEGYVDGGLCYVYTQHIQKQLTTYTSRKVRSPNHLFTADFVANCFSPVLLHG